MDHTLEVKMKRESFCPGLPMVGFQHHILELLHLPVSLYSLLCHTSWKKSNENVPVGIWKETFRKIHGCRIDFWLKMSACAFLYHQSMGYTEGTGQRFSAGVLMSAKTVMNCVSWCHNAQYLCFVLSGYDVDLSYSHEM